VATLLRRSILSLSLLAFVALAVAVGRAQQPQAGQAQTPPPAGAAQATPPPAPAVPPAPRPPSPEQLALTAAVAAKDPAERLAALEKMRTDFPQATLLGTVDSQILITLVANFADRTEEITTVFERVIARIPADAAPDVRLNSTLGPVNQVVPKKLLLDRSEKLVVDAVGGLDLEKYAQAQRDTAKRSSRPEPQQALLETSFDAMKGRGLEALAKIYVAKGDNARALDTYKEAVKTNPVFGTATTALVDMYTAKNDYASAEALLKDAVKSSTTPIAASRPSMALADLYVKKGDAPAAQAILEETVKANPTLAAAILALARVEETCGDPAAALGHYEVAAVAGSMKAADEAAMRTLYRNAHNGSEAGLEETLDKAYREKFPNPVTPEAYKRTFSRSNRLVLLEMFTGSGCPPCVAADLAFDAAMERYGEDNVIALAYHENIPAPDPMVAANNDDRRKYYSVNGVPTFEIDGAMVANANGSNRGGGGREGTPGLFELYKPKIEKALETSAQAALFVSATGEGDMVTVTATVTKLPADAKDVRLHLVLAERELKFTGENGIRFHPMAVRATAGEKGAGIPISATGTTQFTFNLATIKDELTKTLAAEMVKRHSTEAPGSTPREYVAEGRAYTKIDTTELVVVAFLQDGPYQAPPKPATPGVGGAGANAAADSGAAAAEPPAGTAPVASQQTPAKAPDAPLENVLQAARANVVFAAAKGKGGSQ